MVRLPEGTGNFGGEVEEITLDGFSYPTTVMSASRDIVEKQ